MVSERAPIALTVGDPAGVGPDVIAGWLAACPEWQGRVVVIGPERWASKLPCRYEPVGESAFQAEPGQPTAASARVAWEAMEQAAAGCREGRFAAVVTGPVSKHGLKQIGYPFPGQTEFFAARWGGEATMGFVGEALRVILATWHEPLFDVVSRFHEASRGSLSWVEDTLSRAVERAILLGHLEGIAEPRIAVCGLNPHAGEQGQLGNEEAQAINPVLANLRQRHPFISDSLPADTVFKRLQDGHFDVAVSLYHDQGLIAVKTLEFDSAVNVSLGLPHVRTSPDHGTGFDIAGKGQARWTSFDKAVRVAARHAAHLSLKA